jgi:Glycosyltransferase family 87
MCANSPASKAPPLRLGLNDGTLTFAAVTVLIFGAVFWTARSPNVEKTDFSLVYVGARIVHSGMGSSLYDSNLQKSVRDSLFSHPVPLFFEHPPFEALLLSPLAKYSFRAASLVWGIFNAAVWIGLMFVLRKFLNWPGDGLAYVFLWIFFAPLWVALYQGQSSIVVLAAYSMTFVLLRQNLEFAAGIVIGLGLFKFQFILPFVLIFLLCKKFRFVAGFAVSAAALLLISLAGIGWTGLVGYTRFLLAIGNNPQNVSFGSGVDMPTIHGLVFAVLGRSISGTGLNLVVAALSLALLGWVSWKWNSMRTDHTSEPMFAAAVGASLLCGSHMFTHDFSPLIVAMLLALGHSSVGKKDQGVGAAAVAVRISSALFWMFPIYFLAVKWHCLYLMAPVLLLFIWGSMRIAGNVVPATEVVVATNS